MNSFLQQSLTISIREQIGGRSITLIDISRGTAELGMAQVDRDGTWHINIYDKPTKVIRQFRPSSIVVITPDPKDERHRIVVIKKLLTAS